MKLRKFLITETQSEVGLKKGEIVYEFIGQTYGCLEDDEYMFNEPCIAVTSDPEGKNPFRIARYSMMEEIL